MVGHGSRVIQPGDSFESQSCSRRVEEVRIYREGSRSDVRSGTGPAGISQGSFSERRRDARGSRVSQTVALQGRSAPDAALLLSRVAKPPRSASFSSEV